jgi:endonuclease III
MHHHLPLLIRRAVAKRKSYYARNIDELLDVFLELYPNPESELHFRGSFQLLISVMLSAQCTDKKVNDVTPILFKKYPNAKKLSEASLADIEAIIRPINYYKTKAKHLIHTAQALVAEHGGKVPTSRTSLTALAGVGQKTANVVLGELDIEPAFPVDTHVFRVSKRLGLAQSEKREQVEEELKALFPPTTWRPLHHWLIFHGRRVCKAQSPQCSQCSLSHGCPSTTTLSA